MGSAPLKQILISAPVTERRLPNSFPGTNAAASPDCGRKLTCDNLDYHQNVHYMTEEHQNIDKHYVTYMSAENCVSGNYLSDKVPVGGVMMMEDGHCLPNRLDNSKQSENYINLVECVIATNIPCLKFFSDVYSMHIPHMYSGEMKRKSKSVSYHLSGFIL